MKFRKTPVLWIIVSFAFVSLCFFLMSRQLFIWALAEIFASCDSNTEVCNFANKTPEEIFVKYVLDYQSDLYPTEVTGIQGVEGAIAFGVQGPAFLKFTATDQFITELLKRESSYGQYGRPGQYTAYSKQPCTLFHQVSNHPLQEKFPDKFDWWQPLNITSPVCYQSVGNHYNDGSKRLLVDFEENTVYFYNSEICQICQD